MSHIRNLYGALTLLAAVATVQAAQAATITFSPGHYYSSNHSSRTVLEYDPAGNVVGSLNVASDLADEIRGIAFGSDGLLYMTALRPDGFVVLAFDSSATLRLTYAMTGANILPNLSLGKIAVDGQHIYVAGANQLIRFDVGNPASGMPIYNEKLFDVEILPSGNLLVASYREVNEITPDGSLVRRILPRDVFLEEIRGIEYDALSNNLFVTHLGYTDFFYRLMRFDATTGALEENVSLNYYGDDLFLTRSGDLLLGSGSDHRTPRVYTQELDQIGVLRSPSPQSFVTEYVPEPATCLLLIIGLIGLWTVRTVAPL